MCIVEQVYPVVITENGQHVMSTTCTQHVYHRMTYYADVHYRYT
jgi:hypothetical protein